MPQRCSQVTISQGQRLRGIVELTFLCVPLANTEHIGTENSAHSIAGRQSEQVGLEDKGYQKEQDQGWFHEDMLDWSVRLWQS